MINKKIIFSLLAARCRFLSAAAAEVATRHGPLHRRIDEKDDGGRKDRSSLNLPVTDRIHYGDKPKAATSRRQNQTGRKLGGLFNLKGVEKNTRCAESGG